MLSNARVTPKIAQELLRHSDIRLTMQTYTHLELLDTTRAVESLPMIHKQKDQRKLMTGTDGRDSGFEVGAQIGALRQANVAKNSHSLTRQASQAQMDNPRKTPVKKEQKQPLSFTDKGCLKAGEEIRTPDVQLGKLTFYH